MTSQSIEFNVGWDQDVQSDRARVRWWPLEKIAFVGAVGMGYVICALSFAYPIVVHLFFY